MKKMLLWLTLTAAIFLLLAPAATAQYDSEVKESTANPTAIVTKTTGEQTRPCPRQGKPTKGPSLATSYNPVAPALVRPPCIYYLRKTGGLPLVTPLTLGALAILVGSGALIRSIVREKTPS